MGKTCAICGKPSGMYPLCRDCLDLKDEGEIVKCPDCGTWHYASKSCVCSGKNEEVDTSVNENTQKYCVVCGEPIADKYDLCKSCYYEMQDYIDSLDKNSSMAEFREYYYNLKDNIWRMRKFDKIQSNCNKLIAIARLNYISNDDASLYDRVFKDVAYLIALKKPKEDTPVAPTVVEEDEKHENIFAATDGHMVKSSMEQIVDDILWNASILHAYEQPIIEFINERKKCDWFIPVTGTGSESGIYIEYWGMNTPEYERKRKEKEELYKKYNVPYIGIEKDEPKDIPSCRVRLLQDLQRIAVERFGFCPKWKK